MSRFIGFSNARPARALLPVILAACLLAGFFLLITPSPAQALGEDVCSSGCAFSSIQAAIDAASSGDTITLAAETFTETLTITKSITLAGAGATIIQAADGPNLAAGRVITMSGQITVNLKDLTLRYGNTDYGSGIYIVSGSANLTNTQLLSSTASIYGGGVYLESITATLRMASSEVRGNSAVEGAGIYIYDGSAALTKTQVLSNTAISYGGGVEVNGYDAFLRMSGGEVRGNSANEGAGIDVTSGSAVLTNTLVLNNSASGGGGGIYIYDCCANLTMSGGEVRGNSANQGAGIYIYEGSAVLSDTQVISNSASTGAGLYVEFGIAELTNTLVLSNSATTNGGGIEVYDYDAILFMSDSQVRGNSADIGAGIDVTSGTAVLTSTLVLSNTAASDGGGVYLFDCCAILAMINSEVRGNSATNGSGLYLKYSSAALIDTQVISNSAASDGGGLFVEDISAYLQFSGGDVSGNSAANGSAIYLNNGSISTLDGFAINGDVFQFDGDFDARLSPLILDGALTLQGGLFGAPSSFNLTGVFSHTGGTYQQTQTLTSGIPAGFPKVGGLVITSTASDPGSTEVVIRAGIDCTTIPNETVRHCYSITPTLSAGVSMDAAFYFNPSEIPPQVCENLAAWHWNGVIWDASPLTFSSRDCVSTPNRLSVSGINSFSPFALRQINAPSAVGALRLQARPAGPNLWLAALAGVLAVAVLPLRKKAGTRTRRPSTTPG